MKILPEVMDFDIYESVILLDAYLNLDKFGDTKAHTARLVSAKLRALAIKRGCIIKDAFRSEAGIQGRLRKMDCAFASNDAGGNTNVPQVFRDAIDLYGQNRTEYRRILKKTNQLIGKIVLPEDEARIKREKQLAKDAAPVQKTKFVKTKKDRKLKETYPQAFNAVYQALESRFYTSPDGVTATDIFQDLKKKYPRKIVIEILQGASWAREIRTGKYVHILGASIMSTQERNEKKFFSWLKNKISDARFEAICNHKNTICMILLQRKVIKKPFFLIEDADEIRKVSNKVASCFANVKLRTAALQMVTMYASYLEEMVLSSDSKESDIVPPSDESEGIETVLQDELFLPLREELERQNIVTVEALRELDLWAFMNRFNLYSIGTRHVVLSRILAQIDPKNDCMNTYILYLDEETYCGSTPTAAFLQLCETMATAYPLKFRSLVGRRIQGTEEKPLHKNFSEVGFVKMAHLNAYIADDLPSNTVIMYARWLCEMCGKRVDKISVDELCIEPMGPTPPSGESDSNASMLTVQTPLTEKDEDPILVKAEAMVLQADMDGLSYGALSDLLNISLARARELVGKSKFIVDVYGKLMHEEAFIDWEDGAAELESIMDKLMRKNNGYISRTQLFAYAHSEMNMFLNDNDLCNERAVYDIAKHLFEKNQYHGKRYLFSGNMHISGTDNKISSNLDLYKKYAAEQGGVFSLTGLVEYLQNLGVNTGNLRSQMRLQTESIFFYYDEDVLISAESMNMDEAWEQTVAAAVRELFADVGDHIVLRAIPEIWYDRLPPLPDSRKWTPLLLQSVLRFYSEEIGARTIRAMDGQAIETLHAMLVEIDSPIQNFGDVVISHIIDQGVSKRQFLAEDLRLELVDAGILKGNELIWNMPKALKGDSRFAWDVAGTQVTIKI